MAGTNIAAAKVAATGLITTALAAEDVAVSYSFDGKKASTSRDIVYFGATEGSVELSAMRGSARIKRNEDPVTDLVIESFRPGEITLQVTDARVVAIGVYIEEVFASNYTLGSVTNLKLAEIVGLALDGFIADGSATSTLTYQVRFLSQLA